MFDKVRDCASAVVNFVIAIIAGLLCWNIDEVVNDE
jgi:hypothetical protein